MVGNESEKQAKDKDSKVTAAANQDQPSCTSAGPANPEWPGFQAYSPVPPHGFVASSHQGHPYMWGVQPMMPPYGTPPHPYVAMYPHGGIYAHPSIPPGSYPFSPFVMPSSNGPAEASGNFPGSMEGEGKPHEVKEKLPIKRSKGSLGSLNMIMGKDNELAKTSGTSANGVDSKSGDSATEDSTDGSDSNSQNDSQTKTASKQDSMEGETSHNGSSVRGLQHRGPNAPNTMASQAMQMVPYSAAVPGAVPGPATNLNIGMEYWGTPTSAHVPSLHGKVRSAAVTGGIVTPGSRDSLQPQLWMQDEREIKKERRKQSNRESARRSRLRKQAECEELAHHAESLKDENAALREEMNRIRTEYEQLIAENLSLKEKLGDIPDSDRDGQDLNNDSQQIGKTDEPTQNSH